MLYIILLFSIKPQHESAIGIHTSPPFWTSLPSPSPSQPSRLIQSPCLSFLSHTANSLLAIYFTHVNISFHVTLSIHLTLSSPLPMSTSLFSMSVSELLPCKEILQYHFSRFCILEYDIYLSLSDLLHSVQWILGSSTSLELTQRSSFLWLSNIPLCICTTSLSIHLLMDI